MQTPDAACLPGPAWASLFPTARWHLKACQVKLFRFPPLRFNHLNAHLYRPTVKAPQRLQVPTYFVIVVMAMQPSVQPLHEFDPFICRFALIHSFMRRRRFATSCGLCAASLGLYLRLLSPNRSQTQKVEPSLHQPGWKSAESHHFWSSLAPPPGRTSPAFREL